MLPLNKFFQLAYITRNLETGVAMLRERYGIGEALIFEPNTVVQTAWGTGLSSVRAALAWTGALQIELIQPVSGLIDVYRPYMPKDDSLVFHHVAVRTDDWDGLLEEIQRQNITVAYRGSVEGLNYIYLDTRQTLGHYLEYIWATPEMWTATGYPGN
jgi:hypothetical protein